jgi:hypothetical protein
VHRSRVMSKMVARSVADLVRFGSRVGLEIQPTLGIGASDIRWRLPLVSNKGLNGSLR